jgi:transcriptional regulator with XRE-family HTH domain
MDDEFDLGGALRRIRRIADLSQRELATASGISVSSLAHAEAGTRQLPVGALARAAAVAGLRLALVDAEGAEIAPMDRNAVRDMGGRFFPAHLDTAHSDERPGRFAHRYDRPRPWYTFDRDRQARDGRRERQGIPEDHRLPQPDDAPLARQAARRAEWWRRRREEWARRLAAGEVVLPPLLECTCPPECDELDEGLRPVHADHCPCRCDLD